MAALEFNDGSGNVALRGALPAPANRFRSFTPAVLPIGPSVTNLSSGRMTQWTYRTEYRVSLDLPFISARVYNGESGTTRAQRFIAHMVKGGVCTVDVEDSVGSAAKLNCWLAEGTTPTLSLEDPSAMFYTLSITLARGGDPFVAVYGGFVP